MADIVLIGGGGHCRSCIEVIESEGKFSISGIVDEVEAEAGGLYPYLGSDVCLPEWVRGRFFLITIGSIGPARKRERIFKTVASMEGASPAQVIARSATVARSARVESGTIVMHQVVINSSATIGHNCIINTRALLEHDTCVGNHVHVATGAIVNGGCSIGDGAFIGSGSIIKQGVKIGPDVWIGMGSVVMNNLNLPGWYGGNPARALNISGGKSND
ncbi:MAG: NeuD/PglB/VioB family sugar acetyltransferase [Spirochaetales bacterium]|nr:NeuD/PglB/VioB family sugar acetyltransferase [Spirochaetales bacterium]